MNEGLQIGEGKGGMIILGVGKEEGVRNFSLHANNILNYLRNEYKN